MTEIEILVYIIIVSNETFQNYDNFRFSPNVVVTTFVSNTDTIIYWQVHKNFHP